MNRGRDLGSCSDERRTRFIPAPDTQTGEFMAWLSVGFRCRAMTPTTLRPALVEKRRLSETTSIYVEAAQRRFSQDPDDVDALFTLAVWHATLGDTRRSLALLHRVTRRTPVYPGVWRLKAHVYRQRGNERMAALCEQTACRYEG